jgi:hypothetical protein
VVPFRVLPRTKPADSQVKSRRFTLLQTLGRCASRQLLWNQANPHSFGKTPGVGCTTTKPSFRISNLQTLSRVSSNQSVTKLAKTAGGPSTFVFRFSYFASRFSSLMHRFATPLFSDCYKPLFPQAVCFYIYTRPPGVTRKTHPCKASSRE